MITFSYLSNVDCPNPTTLLWWISWTIHVTFRNIYFQIIRWQVISTKTFICMFNSRKQKSKITAKLITLLWGIVIKYMLLRIKNPCSIIPVAIGSSAYIQEIWLKWKPLFWIWGKILNNWVFRISAFLFKTNLYFYPYQIYQLLMSKS